MPRSSAFLPEVVDTTMERACKSVGLDPAGASLIRLGENMLYQLATAPVVVRIARDLQRWEDARKEVSVAAWLTSRGFPAARTYEVGTEQPLAVDEHPITFWQFLPGRAANVDEAGVLGDLLKRLHHLPPPSLDLPAVQPFDHVSFRLESAPIPAGDKSFLAGRVADLERRLKVLTFTLPAAALHGDAHVKNVMIDHAGPTLIDLEAFAWGPAEWDLAKTAAEASMGMIGADDYRAFASAYGYDITRWDGWPVMLGIQQLKMVTWLAQNVDHSPRIRLEYEKRVATIRTGELTEPWCGF